MIDDMEMSDEEDGDLLWQISQEDRITVASLISLFESHVRPSLHAMTLCSLAYLLLFLRRLPRFTEGVWGQVTFAYRFNNELSYTQIDISGEGIQLSTGGSTYDPGVGSDSFSDCRFVLAPDGDHYGSLDDVDDWIARCDELISLGGHISTENFVDEGIDWDEDDAEQNWERLD